MGKNSLSRVNTTSATMGGGEDGYCFFFGAPERNQLAAAANANGERHNHSWRATASRKEKGPEGVNGGGGGWRSFGGEGTRLGSQEQRDQPKKKNKRPPAQPESRRERE